MKRLRLVFAALCLGVLVWACVPTGTPTLALNAIENATGARIEIAATEGDGTVGKGVVTLTASTGTLGASTLTLDEYGGGSVILDCDPIADTACLTARVVAQWTPKGAKEPLEEQVRLNFGTGSGTGGGGGGLMVDRYDGGLAVITDECGARVPELNPTCCRTNQEFGKQQPRCTAVQMQPGATFPVNFNGFLSGTSTTPLGAATYNLTFHAPTSILALANCSDSSTATLTAAYNGESAGVSGTVVYGRLTNKLWVGAYAGGGGIVPIPEVCTLHDMYPERLGYYVTLTGLNFTGSDFKVWRQSGSETYFYTVQLGSF